MNSTTMTPPTQADSKSRSFWAEEKQPVTNNGPNRNVETWEKSFYGDKRDSNDCVRNHSGSIRSFNRIIGDDGIARCSDLKALLLSRNDELPTVSMPNALAPAAYDAREAMLLSRTSTASYSEHASGAIIPSPTGNVIPSNSYSALRVSLRLIRKGSSRPAGDRNDTSVADLSESETEPTVTSFYSSSLEPQKQEDVSYSSSDNQSNRDSRNGSISPNAFSLRKVTPRDSESVSGSFRFPQGINKSFAVDVNELTPSPSSKQRTLTQGRRAHCRTQCSPNRRRRATVDELDLKRSSDSPNMRSPINNGRESPSSNFRNALPIDGFPVAARSSVLFREEFISNNRRCKSMPLNYCGEAARSNHQTTLSKRSASFLRRHGEMETRIKNRSSFAKQENKLPDPPSSEGRDVILHKSASALELNKYAHQESAPSMRGQSFQQKPASGSRCSLILRDDRNHEEEKTFNSSSPAPFHKRQTVDGNGSPITPSTVLNKERIRQHNPRPPPTPPLIRKRHTFTLNDSDRPTILKATSGHPYQPLSKNGSRILEDPCLKLKSDQAPIACPRPPQTQKSTSNPTSSSTFASETQRHCSHNATYLRDIVREIRGINVEVQDIVREIRGMSVGETVGDVGTVSAMKEEERFLCPNDDGRIQVTGGGVGDIERRPSDDNGYLPSKYSGSNRADEPKLSTSALTSEKLSHLLKKSSSRTTSLKDKYKMNNLSAQRSPPPVVQKRNTFMVNEDSHSSLQRIPAKSRSFVDADSSCHSNVFDGILYSEMNSCPRVRTCDLALTKSISRSATQALPKSCGRRNSRVAPEGDHFNPSNSGLNSNDSSNADDGYAPAVRSFNESRGDDDKRTYGNEQKSSISKVNGLDSSVSRGLGRYSAIQADWKNACNGRLSLCVQSTQHRNDAKYGSSVKIKDISGINKKKVSKGKKGPTCTAKEEKIKRRSSGKVTEKEYDCNSFRQCATGDRRSAPSESIISSHNFDELKSTFDRSITAPVMSSNNINNYRSPLVVRRSNSYR